MTSGHRVTLTYEMSAEGNASQEAHAAPAISAASTSSTALFAALKTGVDDPTFLPERRCGAFTSACYVLLHHCDPEAHT